MKKNNVLSKIYFLHPTTISHLNTYYYSRTLHCNLKKVEITKPITEPSFWYGKNTGTALKNFNHIKILRLSLQETFQLWSEHWCMRKMVTKDAGEANLSRNLTR